MDPIDDDPRRPQRVAFVVCTILLAIAAMLFVSPRAPQHTVIGGAGVALFGLGAAVHLRRLLAPTPHAVLDAYGLAIDTSGYGLLEWRDIAQASLWQVQGADVLCLRVADPDKYIDRLPLTGRALTWLQPNLGPSTLCIDITAVEGGSSPLLAAVTARLARR
jgi:hypothetical protein